MRIEDCGMRRVACRRKALAERIASALLIARLKPSRYTRLKLIARLKPSRYTSLTLIARLKPSRYIVLKRSVVSIALIGVLATMAPSVSAEVIDRVLAVVGGQ